MSNHVTLTGNLGRDGIGGIRWTQTELPPDDADDDAEWDAREAIERARSGR